MRREASRWLKSAAKAAGSSTSSASILRYEACAPVIGSRGRTRPLPSCVLSFRLIVALFNPTFDPV